MYSQMLVGMVALTGQWWVDVRKPKKTDVAAHLVNLAWNGLRGPRGQAASSRDRWLSAFLPVRAGCRSFRGHRARTSVLAMSDQTPPDPYAVPQPGGFPPPPPPGGVPRLLRHGSRPGNTSGRVPAAASCRLPGTDLSRGRLPRWPGTQARRRRALHRRARRRRSSRSSSAGSRSSAAGAALIALILGDRRLGRGQEGWSTGRPGHRRHDRQHPRAASSESSSASPSSR